MFGEVCNGRGMYAEALTFYPQPEVGKQYSMEGIGFLYNRACAAALAAADEGTGNQLSVEQKACAPQGCARLTDRVPRLLS